ncbi:hypothetical protein [Leptospira alstonii]|uniref:Uncharacterized protein n=1 Tax=Leptospira alstonii serovar Sichuan str. 79601 TaxID=1218565 RepID=M6CYC3_9LEPT|nr:hypothetical protein [Leptospira alstonii]AGS80505.1 hypothetical protein LEP1GSC193_0740 [Leptospira phage vB_LalZ_80412-LE1]EMJ95481.1 hypothetical protein LEP1GSC194_3540 [Leptospira alstonii serovar Sichuan str. 79601]
MLETAFLHPFQILKASPEERTGAIKILVRASSEKEDLQGEVILKSAYADLDMRSEFLTQGYFDYNHLTDLIDKEIQDLRSKGKLSGTELVNLQKAKVESIIGGVERIGFKDDFPQNLGIKNDGLYIQGRLFPENKFAEEISKGLQAGFMGWGASVSGYARPQDYQGKTIRKIQLRKCAIAPLQEVYNPDTAVQLIKGAVLLRDIEKSSLPVPSEDLQNPESLDRLFRIERKLDFLSKLFLSDPNTQDKFLDLIFSDIANRTKTQELKLGSSWIRSVLSDEFYLEGEDLENFTDLLFLKLNGES